MPDFDDVQGEVATRPKNNQLAALAGLVLEQGETSDKARAHSKASRTTAEKAPERSYAAMEGVGRNAAETKHDVQGPPGVSSPATAAHPVPWRMANVASHLSIGPVAGAQRHGR
mmetsp:Transcript_43701/g.125042  ORF Transcript_43701/g.125042 Transcript_43701/m.125042 type:complete len:114 (+) Transcript_43701:136-477(+)